jgi:hypothetical protein
MREIVTLLALVEILLASHVVAAQAREPSTAKAEAEAETAAAASPTVPQFRGGTLGVPDTGGRGVLALISGQTNTESFNANVFARVGRLDLAPRVTLDVVGETFTTSAPGTTFVPGQGSPLLTLGRVTLTSLGVRLRVHTPSPSGLRPRVASRCVTELPRLKADDGQRKLEEAEGAHKGHAGCPNPANAQCAALQHSYDVARREFRSARAIRSECKEVAKVLGSAPHGTVENMTKLELARGSGWALMPGMRFLYRPDSPAGNAVGAAAELALQYAGQRGAIFASGAFTWLEKTKAKDDDRVAIQNRVSEVRASLGGFLQFRAQTPGQAQVRPQVGAYVSTSRNFWNNQFHGDDAAYRIRGLQLEAAVYASGHFTGGFSGLISMGILRPYGAGPVQFVLSIAPAFGTSLKAKEEPAAGAETAIPSGQEPAEPAPAVGPHVPAPSETGVTAPAPAPAAPSTSSVSNQPQPPGAPP